MMTFDYATAHDDLIAPRWRALDPKIHALYLATVEATEAESLNQGPDLNTRWPSDAGPYAGLRVRFQTFDPDALAIAARVVYFAGHWYHQKALFDLPGRKTGAHWKFANYCDQVLRARYNLGRSDSHQHGTGLAIHEGEIRVSYASPDCWTWTEIGPATVAGLDEARAARARIDSALIACGSSSTRFRKDREARDHAAHVAMEAERASHPSETAPYMVDESEIIRRNESRLTDEDRAITRQRALDSYKASIADKRTKLDREEQRIVWFLSRGLSVENVIYYDSRDTVCIGWRHTLTDRAISDWLDIMVEYPWTYEIKGHAAYSARQNAGIMAKG